MDTNWTKQAAYDAAKQKVRDADALLSEAADIFKSIERHVAHLDVNEARVCLDEVIGR